MSSQVDRPTIEYPDDCETTVYHRAPTLADGDSDAPPESQRPDAVDQALRAFSDPPPRDTIVDRPSLWTRLRSWFAHVLNRVRDALPRQTLTARLPPVPPRRADPWSTRVSGPDEVRNERGEFVLLELFRMPLPYQRAALYVARRAVKLRGKGENAYADGVVHFALSRCTADADGMIPIERVRDILGNLPYEKTLKPALLRLVERGLIQLFPPVDTRNERKLPRAKVLVKP